MKQTDISVVVPCFNEASTIRKNLATVHNYLSRNFRTFEIIAVNDGSTDGTAKELERIRKDLPITIIHKKINGGKGSAVRSGVSSAKYGVVMFLDADLGIPIEELGKFIETLNKGCDIVIASRFVPGLKIRRPVSWHRKIMEKAFRFLRMMIVNEWDVKDTQCGFKLFRKEVAQKIFPKLTLERFAFDAEFIFVAGKHGFEIRELPISLQNPPNSHVRIIRDPINMFFDLIRIRLNDAKGLYE